MRCWSIIQPSLSSLASMFDSHQIRTIETQLARSAARTQVLQLDDRKIVVKQPEAPLKHWGYPVLNALAQLLGQPMLRAVPAPGGQAAQGIEVARLRALAAAGVSVPEVLHVSERWFALSYLGARSVDQLLRHDAQNGQRYWEDALQAIRELHRLGQTASQCFARNLIWHEGKVSFIDFEDDPINVMPLASAQARDWLLFLHSTAFTLNFATNEEYALRFMHYLRQDDATVRQQVEKAAHTFGWLRFLPKQRKPWGRDVMSAQRAADILHLLSRQMHAQGIV
jgi:tRNA A-37 threonylcarbamoyl transferase component Bud32